MICPANVYQAGPGFSIICIHEGWALIDPVPDQSGVIKPFLASCNYISHNVNNKFSCEPTLRGPLYVSFQFQRNTKWFQGAYFRLYQRMLCIKKYK